MINVTVGDYVSRIDAETLTSQNMAIILAVSNVPLALAPATEEEIVACVVCFYEEGKGGESFRKKNTFRCKVKFKREERSLQKLKDTKASDKSMTFTNIFIKLVLV